MPELPEVETTARGLRARLVGQRVASVEVFWARTLANASASELERALSGREVVEVGRRGKFVVIHFAGGVAVAVHRRMTGNLLLRAASDPPERALRLVLTFDSGLQLRFDDTRKFGRLVLLENQSAAERFLRSVAGPEPLDGLTAARLEELLRVRRGRLKALLLNQRFLAGIGNLYADEILWRARLHPERVGASLAPDEVARLAEAISSTLNEAIERRGTSFDDYLDAEGEPGENQLHLQVYGRAGQPCFRCETPILKYTLGQRGTHFCPSCQRLPGGKPANAVES